MIWLSSSTLARLRDRLQARGQRASLATSQPGLGVEAVIEESLREELGPLCEAMFLMMAADGELTADERDVVKGAMRSLSGDLLRGEAIAAMLEDARARYETSGEASRLRSIALALQDDPARSEVAFLLAAAVAFADHAIADEENATLNAFAEALGLSEGRANALLDSIQADLALEASSHAAST